VATLAFETVFRGTPPARDSAYLLDQSIGFVKGHWLGHLPDRAYWPAELDDRTTVDRRVLFAIGARADDELGAIHTLVAAQVWTVGTKWRNAAKLGSVFDANPGTVGANLAHAVRTARADGPVAGYAALARRGSHALARLAPADIGRVLHFGAYDPATGGPLILDQHVTVGVNALRGSDWSPDGPWSAEQYGDYLGYAADWAERWAPGTATDLVERTLAAAGQALGRA
jgi:8-oxoguanine DNA glycosylase-like protein